MFEAIRENAEHQCFNFGDRAFPRLPVSHRARYLGHLRDEATIGFLFGFNNHGNGIGERRLLNNRHTDQGSTLIRTLRYQASLGGPP